jgi:hypothetical protein
MQVLYLLIKEKKKPSNIYSNAGRTYVITQLLYNFLCLDGPLVNYINNVRFSSIKILT